MDFYNEKEYLKEPIRKEFISKMEGYYKEYCGLCKKDSYEYPKLIEEYDDYIKKIALLIKEVSLKNNSISASVLISVLINSGFFSYNNCLTTSEDVEEIVSKPGLSVILGNGVCRNTSFMHKDIFDIMNENSAILCISTNKSKCANHVINLIIYNNVLYGYDTLNKKLLKFKNSLELESYEISRIYKYKPYMNMELFGTSMEEVKQQLILFKKNSKETAISEKEYLDIKNETTENVLKNISLIKDFDNETTIIKCKIKSMYEIKGRPNYYN